MALPPEFRPTAGDDFPHLAGNIRKAILDYYNTGFSNGLETLAGNLNRSIPSLDTTGASPVEIKWFRGFIDGPYRKLSDAVKPGPRFDRIVLRTHPELIDEDHLMRVVERQPDVFAEKFHGDDVLRNILRQHPQLFEAERVIRKIGLDRLEQAVQSRPGEPDPSDLERLRKTVQRVAELHPTERTNNRPSEVAEAPDIVPPRRSRPRVDDNELGL